MPPAQDQEPARVGLVSVSDRASRGEYGDAGIPALRDWLSRAVVSPLALVERVIPDDRALIERTLVELADHEGCHLVLTTGGTGPAPRDVTPDATLAVADRVLEGFGERMRQIGLRFVPTAILSRQVGALRGRTLIVNLPGQPRSIRETLEGARAPDGSWLEVGIFSAIPYCVELAGGPRIHTRPEIVAAYRPKSAGP